LAVAAVDGTLRRDDGGNTIARLIDPFDGGGRCWLKSMRQFEWNSSQVAVGQGQRSQPGHESGGRAIWTVNAVDRPPALQPAPRPAQKTQPKRPPPLVSVVRVFGTGGGLK
jgi:hypothetical protein